MILVAVTLVILSYLHKLSCTTIGSSLGFRADSTDTRVYRFACYSDTLALFSSRDLGKHVFPYVHGWYTATPLPAVHGGTVEYPTLTGIWVWVSALFASGPVGFLTITTITFIPAVAITVISLQRIAGRRAWIFAATPPLALYALYNWDLLPVAATSVGLAVALAGPSRWSPLTKAIIAAVCFGIGGAFKLYPVIFVAPLVLALLINRSPRSWTHRLRDAALTTSAGLLPLALSNVPFMLINFDGWFSVFQFQAHRMIGASTLSIWYWGLLPWSATPGGTAQHLMGAASAAATALGLGVVLVAAAVLGKRHGQVPWIGAAAAMLCVYMVFNKVNSLQYVLWLLPFFVILQVRTTWVVAYLLADLAAFVGWYRQLFYTSLGNFDTTWANQVLAIGVWGRAALLLALVVVFLRAAPTVPVHSEASTPAIAAVPAVKGLERRR